MPVSVSNGTHLKRSVSHFIPWCRCFLTPGLHFPPVRHKVTPDFPPYVLDDMKVIMLNCYSVGVGKPRLSVVVIFSITTIVGTFLSRRLWDINFVLGAVDFFLTALCIHVIILHIRIAFRAYPKTWFRYRLRLLNQRFSDRLLEEVIWQITR